MSKAFQTFVRSYSKQYASIQIKAENTMIFSGLRFPHKGFWNAVIEASKFSMQKVAIVYPRNPNPNSKNPFSDQQRIAMIKEYAKKMA